MEIKTTRVTCGRDNGEAIIADPACEYNVFETITDTLEHLSEGAVMDLINTQTKTNAMNVCREAFRDANDPKLTKRKIQSLATARMTPEEFGAAGGDPAKIDAIIAGHAMAIAAEHAA